MNPISRMSTIVLAGLAIASCGDSESGQSDKGPVRNSEILEGSISDDMIHYDTLRSQPAALEPEDEEAANGGESREDSGTPAPAGGQSEPAPDSSSDAPSAEED